jgi:hypothetical protein
MPKFCEKCGATVQKPEQRFCLQCGAPLAPQEPPPHPAATICRSCGTAIKPGEKFCSKCLVRIPEDVPQQPRVTPAPVTSPIIPPVSRTPASVSPVPVSTAPQSVGTSRKNIAIAGILGLVLLIGVVVLFSGDDVGQPGNSFTGSWEQIPREGHDISDQSISVQDIQQRDQVLAGVAAALDNGDEQALLAGLSTGTREKYGAAGFGFSNEESAALADALRNARPITEYPQSTMFETSIGGKTLTFVMWKEGGSWKISGL